MEILSVTNQLILTIKEPLDKKVGSHFESASEFFFYHVLERIKCNCQGIQLIMDNPKNIANAEHTLGLTCRNQISDLLVSSYILLESQNDSEINEKVLLLFKDDFKFLMSLLNNVSDVNDIKKNITGIKQDFESAFGTFNVPKREQISLFSRILIWLKLKKKLRIEENKFPSITGILKYLKKRGVPKFQDNPFLYVVQESIQYWIALSKYEHIGYNSHHYTRGINSQLITFYVKGVLKASCLLSVEFLGKIGVEQEKLKPLILTYLELVKDVDDIIVERRNN
jgi:hypothetical protein